MSAVVTSAPSPKWGLVLLQGIVSIIFGFLLVLAPQWTIPAVIIFLGAYWFVMGVISIIGIFVGYSRAHWGWALFGGIVGIAAGILVLANPLMASLIVPATLIIILAFFAIVMGIVILIEAFKGGGWGAIVLGIIMIIIGILLFLSPLMSAFLLITLWGILLIVGGIMATISAFQIRGASKKK